MPATIELPIFELPLVLVPGELLPLHIFEERYRHMVADCERLDEPFGVLWRGEDGEVQEIGCTARLDEILQRYDDGRLDIVVRGEYPFRALRRYEGELYPVAEAELIEVSEQDSDPEAAASARETFLRLVKRVVEGADPEPDAGAIAGDSAFTLAARITLPPETKQALLEEPAEAERMRMLARGLAAVETALARSAEIAERAKSNGHAPLGG